MFSARIGLQPLATMCRALATMLESGVALPKALQTVAFKSSSSRYRQALTEITDQIRSGDELREACAAQGDYFPPLFIDLVGVGETTGALPEVLIGLAEHYENLIRLRRTFISVITWPILQFVMATFILTALIFLLGMIGSSRGTEPVDVLGLGLVGTSGAITFFVTIWGTIASLIFIYLVLTRSLRQKTLVHQFLLRIPVIGGCLRSFAIARFAWAFAMTQQTGMSILQALPASLRATSNGAFIAEGPPMVAMLQSGEPLHETLSASGLFPRDFLEIVTVAETTGTVPEVLQRLSPQFEDQARRSLFALAATVGWLVWALVAGLIVFVIFSVFMNVYLNPINELLQEI